jgi:hypothetical protein
MPAYIQAPVIDRSDRRSRNSYSDTRHLAALQKSAGRFMDVSKAELAFEAISDPQPLPPLEHRIGTASEMCAAAALGEIAADRDDLPPPHILIRRRFHPADRRAVKAPA